MATKSVKKRVDEWEKAFEAEHRKKAKKLRKEQTELLSFMLSNENPSNNLNPKDIVKSQ